MVVVDLAAAASVDVADVADCVFMCAYEYIYVCVRACVRARVVVCVYVYVCVCVCSF